MTIFKKKVTFSKFCEYGFNTWEKHYIPHKSGYTYDAIEAAGLTDKFTLTKEQVDFIWTELEYLYCYLVVIYSYYHFAGKHSAEEVSYAVSQVYVNFLLLGLRKENKTEAGKAMDAFMNFMDGVDAILNSLDESAPVEADSMATFGVMVLSKRVKTQIPNLDDEVIRNLIQRVWAAGKSGYSLVKITWQ